MKVFQRVYLDQKMELQKCNEILTPLDITSIISNVSLRVKVNDERTKDVHKILLSEKKAVR